MPLVDVEADTDSVNCLLPNMAAKPNQEGLGMNASPWRPCSAGLPSPRR